MKPVDRSDAIVVSELGKRYGATWAVRGVSFTLQPGAMLGLVGANGGGKTTTLRMLAGLVRPDTGQGHVLGHDIGRPSTALRSNIGYMSQKLSLYPELSVAENLAFRAAVLRLPDRPTAIARAAERYGLGGVLATRFDRLSGGWARRAQFAAVTLGDPPLLLLDEPTAGLDVATRRAIWGWLGEFAAAGHCVIVSTHDLIEAERCPTLLHYAEGCAEGPMTPADFVASAGGGDLEDVVHRLAGTRR
ncbi:ABC transporter ATP-binding protein [Sphingomonas sp. UYP23]